MAFSAMTWQSIIIQPFFEPLEIKNPFSGLEMGSESAGNDILTVKSYHLFFSPIFSLPLKIK